jgi:xanthine dehydrogenase accessory factor
MNMLQRAARLQAEGVPFTLATVTWRREPTSGKRGSKAIIHPDGTVEGWMGGACARDSLVRHALDALSTGEPRLVVLGEPEHRDSVDVVAMACASEGAMEVYVEPVLPQPSVLIVGSSPMVETLRRLVAVMGWRASSTENPADAEAAPARSYIVVASQGHYDEPAIEAALRSHASYIGLVASEKRASSIKEWLRERDVAEEAIARIHAPAGIDLGHTEHEEIAVAVLAELVAFKAAGAGAQVAVVERPEIAIDPVCEMEVDVARAKFVSEYDGSTYYFCAAGCQRAFEADPSVFLA